MAEIVVTSSTTASGWTLEVRVEEGASQTRHAVTLKKDDFLRLTQGTPIPPETLVKKSFEFLLEREPKESILRQFDLLVIARYFPEYPAEIRRRLAG